MTASGASLTQYLESLVVWLTGIIILRYVMLRSTGSSEYSKKNEVLETLITRRVLFVNIGAKMSQKKKGCHDSHCGELNCVMITEGEL